ncbi:hypothetical protein ABGB14_03430 [Nonomuraea sp. B10E15]
MDSWLPVALYGGLAAVISIVCVIAVRTHDQLTSDARTTATLPGRQ